jgi:redox-sensitive bicupin YhaK (pirin superfamily)
MEKKLLAILDPKERHWVGDGFFVHNLFHPRDGLYEALDPFILLDYAPPTDFTPNNAEPRGVGEHPHRGFETVSIVYCGELSHRDSTGAQGTIGPGGVQWMTAGRGVVHEERHSGPFSKNGGRIEMLQLWVNLPSHLKMTEPKYQDFQANHFQWSLLNEGVRIRPIAGAPFDKKSPCLSHTPIAVFDLEFMTPSEVKLPIQESFNCIAICRSGTIHVNEKKATAKQTLLFSRDGSSVTLKAEQPSHLLFLCGKAIGEPMVSHGPFVMNSQTEILTAITDYQAGNRGQLRH